MKVIVGLRKESKYWKRAQNDGLIVKTVAEAAEAADIMMILVPDDKQRAVYLSEIEPHLKKGNALAFGHGFNIHFGQVVPPSNVDVFMVAPKGPGHLVRRTFEQGAGVPCLMAVYQNPTKKRQENCPGVCQRNRRHPCGCFRNYFSRRKRKPIFLVNKLFFVAVSPNSSAPGSIPWWKPDTIRNWHTLNACTN